MDVKTILVHVDASRSADERIRFASRLALAHEAHLVGVTQTGIMRYVYGVAPDDWAGDLTPLFEIARSEAELRAAHFETLAGQAGVTSFERRIGDEEPGFALASQAMYADLVVVGQTDREDPVTAHTAIPDYVAVHAPCPVLVLPHAGSFAADFGRIMIAWNASPEAARAVRQALPFLVRASEVEVAAIEPDIVSHQAPGGHDLALLLARHGVKVTLRQEQAAGNVADALLARTGAFQADLLVMGCYGHSRFRETVLGGVSRTVLHRMTVPTLMAH